MYKLLQLITLTAALLLQACGGGGASAPTATTATNVVQAPTGSAALAAGVQVLTDDQNRQLISSGGDSIVFAGTGLPFAAGSIIVTDSDAFKITSLRTENGNTVLTVTEPALEELFEELTIAGDFEAAAVENAPTSVVLIDVLRDMAKAINVDLGSFAWTAEPISGVKTKLIGKLRGTVDYSYKRAIGIQRADLTLTMNNELQADLTLSKGETPDAEKQVGSVRIPVNVSLADRLLTVVGVRVVSIYIPFYLGASARAETKFSLNSGSVLTGEFGVRYRPETGLQVIGDLAATRSDKSLTATTPAGAPTLSTFTGYAGPYVRMRPALAFLDRVGLLGIDTRVSADGQMVVQLVPEDPGYCITLAPTVNWSANAYLKAAFLQELKTEAIRKQLYKGDQSFTGACQAPVSVDLLPAAEPRVYGTSSIFRVVANLDPKATFSVPDVPPTGKVVVRVGSTSCEAVLSPLSSVTAAGECTLRPGTTGSSSPASLTYPGDKKYAPGSIQKNIEVGRAQTIAGSSGPAQAVVGSTFQFSASVLPVPTAFGEPTGFISVRDGAGQLVCRQQIVSAGNVSCAVSFVTPGVKQLTATYEGDLNFSGSSGTSISVLVADVVSALTISTASETASTFSYFRITPFVSEGDTHQLSVSSTTGPVPAADLEWTSSNPSYLGVDANGLLSGIGAGSSIITVRHKVTDVRATTTFNVIATVSQGGLAWKLTALATGYSRAVSYCAVDGWRLPTLDEALAVSRSGAINDWLTQSPAPSAPNQWLFDFKTSTPTGTGNYYDWYWGAGSGPRGISTAPSSSSNVVCVR